MTPRPSRPTLFPYTTLFRSRVGHGDRQRSNADTRGGRSSECPPVLPGGGPTGYCRAIASRSRSSGVIRWSMSSRSEEHTSELQSPCNLVCRLLLEKKTNKTMAGKTALIVGGRNKLDGVIARSYTNAARCEGI